MFILGDGFSGTAGRPDEPRRGINCPHCERKISALKVDRSRKKPVYFCPCCGEHIDLSKIERENLHW